MVFSEQSCPDCKGFGYHARYFRIYADAAARVRERLPDFRLRFLVSFLRYAPKPLEWIPPEAELVYYECDRHGLYGYTDEKRIPPHLDAEVRRGRRLLGCVSFRGFGQKYLPLPTLENVEEWVRLVAEHGWRGVNGSIYSNPRVNRLNILRMADAAWNARSRSTEAFLFAACMFDGESQPATRAAALAALSDAWEAWHRVGQTFSEKHGLEWLLQPRGANIFDAVYVTDRLEYHVLPRLGRVLERLRFGARIADELGDDRLADQFEAARIRLTSLRAVLAALHVFGRQQWPDPEKGPWREDWIEAIREHLLVARDALAGYPDLTARVGSLVPGVEGDPAVDVAVLLERIDRVLSEEGMRTLTAEPWPNINAFA